MGSSDSSKDIYRAQTQAEAERQAAINRATGRVNAVFDAPERAASREAFLAALREHYGRGLDKQKTVADRNLRFSMARSGLTGGSAQVDANRVLGEDYLEGLLNAENMAQGSLSDLEAQDEQSRLNLLNMVRQGLDATTATQRAGAAMASNASAAKNQGMMEGLGDAFGTTASIYKQQQDAAERRRGARDAGSSIYGAKNPYAG